MNLDMNLFHKSSSKGFTLIELLVVIGILGILAGTLFFTINPLEQLNRGGDAAKKTAVEGFLNGVNGFYATQTMFPWDTNYANDCSTGGTGVLSQVPLHNGTATHACVTELISVGELRDSFDEDTSVLQEIYVTADADSVAVCFAPESSSEQATANYAQDGTAYVTGDRYWCVVQ